MKSYTQNEYSIITVMAKKSSSKGQVELDLQAELREKDRNFHLGGRSFYFFDFDDNVVHLNTKIVLFHKQDSQTVEIPTADFAEISQSVGQAGTRWADYELRDLSSDTGSFQYFRELSRIDDPAGQPLIVDMLEALSHEFLEWRGPSWQFFKHAVNNNRPLAIITARGHHPNTIKRAINLLVNSRDLEANPNYLSVYPVSHPDIRAELGDPHFQLPIGELKKRAIKASVRDAFWVYEQNPGHRFGMSDDDPENVRLIAEAMQELKVEFPQNAFFVIDTHQRNLKREEITLGKKLANNADSVENRQQVGLFADDVVEVDD